MMPTSKKSKAICILGMHRSGTSTVARSINLLGAYLGGGGKMGDSGPDNLKGFWEHTGIRDIQIRLMKQLQRQWDDTMPLPDGWLNLTTVRPFEEELGELVKTEFGKHSLWAWKDPRSCLSLPLWRKVLEEADTQLACVFVVRSPIEVVNSLAKRNGLQSGHALGMWHYYNLVALRDAMGLPVVFTSYEGLMKSWETELRRCAAALELDWPTDDKGFRMEMNNFIDPNLRHNQSSPQHLQELPECVRELYEVLSEACVSSITLDGKLEVVANRLWAEYSSYASFFPYRPVSSSGWFSRTARRWQRSIRKRLPKSIPFAQLSGAMPSSASHPK